MMRIELEEALQPGEQVDIHLKWWYNINDQAIDFGRSGMEYFEEDDNYLYTIAQFFPRMAVYSDVEGWQNNQFLGSGNPEDNRSSIPIKILIIAVSTVLECHFGGQ